MKILITNYTFSASAKTITFNDYSTISLDGVLLVTNVTDNVIIYNFADSTKGGTVATNVLTLTYDTTSMTDTDNLQIFYEDASLDEDYLIGAGSNSTVTLTLADTAYSIPASAPTENYVIVLYNGSDTDMYVGYANSNANGVLLPSGGRMSFDLGSGQVVYAYCGTAGKIITYSLKKIK